MYRWTFVLLSGLMIGACTDDSTKDSGKTTEPLVDADNDGFPAVEDCDDEDAAVNPSAAESCDGVDNNCDGSTDEEGATGGVEYYADADGDGYGTDDSLAYACTVPTGGSAQGGDCNDGDNAVFPGANEVCDGADNDCDGDVDDADSGVTGQSTFYEDLDGDNYGNPDSSTTACAEPAGFTTEPTDCDDNSIANYPGAPEVCDGADNNCDGNADEGLASVTYYADADGDGYGNPSSTLDSCSLPTGYVADNTDCDDTYGGANPGALEVCDISDIDEDCDGLADTDDSSASGLTTYYEDADGDGYGDAASPLDACELVPGFSTDTTDCDDTSAAINPLALEVCDDTDTDDDCDGLADDGDPDVADQGTYYEDADGDGYGDAAAIAVITCDQGTLSLSADDCDDLLVDINPGATELCDSADTDEDCDGLADDDDDSVTGQSDWYVDADGDGGGDDSTMVTTCDQPSGYVDNATDPYEDVVLDGGFIPAFNTLSEVRDVVVYGNTLYAVGTNSDLEGAIVAVDLTSEVASTVFSGAPLAEPSGISISADGMTLYVADVATENARGNLGDVFSLSVSGSTPAAIDTFGTIEMPTDVAMDENGTLWVVGKSDGGAAYAEISGGAWVETQAYGLVTPGLLEPMSAAVSADGSTLYVLDAMVDAGAGALVAVDTASGSTTELVGGLAVAYGNGLAVDGSGSSIVYATLQPKSFGFDSTRFETGFFTVDTDGANNSLVYLHSDTLATGFASGGGALRYGDTSGTIYTASY